MTSQFMTLVAPIINDGLAPLESALQSAQTNPQDAVNAINELAGSEIENLSTLEDDAIATGAKELLTLIGDIKSKVTTASTPIQQANV